MKTIFSVVLLFLGTTYAKDFIFSNNLPYTIWVGTLGNSGLPAPNNGGFELGPGQEVTVTTDDSWGGRFWGRTGCNFDGNGNGHCETGDCGDKLECNGAGGNPPVTLAEFTLNGYGGLDYYDVSFVDGYNLPIEIAPVSQGQDPNNEYSCGTAGCGADLNANCPDDLRQNNDAGDTVACRSACQTFDTDEYCCRGDHGTPETCESTDWPNNYPKYFKDSCPNAYSYAYDDTTSTYTCQDSGYRITFG